VRLLIISLLVFSSWTSHPVFADKLSLADAIDSALKNNPEIYAAKSKWDASRSAASKSYSLPDPKIGAEFEGIPEGSADLGRAEMRFYTLSQMIPWPGMLLSDGSAASSRTDMQKFIYHSKEREIIRRVKSAYYDLAKSDELIKILSANIGTARQGYKVAQANYAAGKASQVEALKMQVELNRMENELSNMQDERSIKTLELNLLLNDVTDEAMVVDPLPVPGEELNRNRITDLTLENSPLLGMEKSGLEEARAMVGSARSTYMPETMVKWRSQKIGPAPGSNDLMFDLSLPLWFWTKQNRSVEEAERNVSSRQANLKVMQNMLLREVKDHLTMLGIFRRKVKLYDTALLASSRSALKGSLAGYKAGQVDFLMLLDSVRSYLDINKEYYESLADYNIKLAELEEVVGIDLKEAIK